MEFGSNKQQDAQNSDSPLTGWTALWQRLREDGLSIPFFLLWSIPICAAIQYSKDEKLNDFFANIYGEGIALKTIIALFAISLTPVGLALMLGLHPSSKWAIFLRSPARTGRAISTTTFAFISGAIPVLWVAEGAEKMWNLLCSPIVGVFILWATLFVLDSFVVQANSWTVVKKSTLAKVLAFALIFGGAAAPVFLYKQIKNGDYYKVEKNP